MKDMEEDGDRSFGIVFCFHVILQKHEKMDKEASLPRSHVTKSRKDGYRKVRYFWLYAAFPQQSHQTLRYAGFPL